MSEPGIEMMEAVEQVLAEAVFYSDNREYALVGLPVSAVTAAAGIIAEIGEPFSALIVDKDEVSLMIPSEALEFFASRLPGYTTGDTLYRLITIDVEVGPELIGFMARISTALAKAEVSVFPYAAYSRDHVFVPAEQVNNAISSLEGLRAGG